ncbi:MAG: hypothetical protein ACLTBV_31810 [Enterocloster bolteae]
MYDKPILIYTLEGFQKHPQIDAIGLVCIDGWHDVVRAYAKQFNIDKLQWIISGGRTTQESIRTVFFNWKAHASRRISLLYMMESVRWLRIRFYQMLS